MKRFTKFEGVVAPLDMVNVDTDQIIPKQFLKRIERTGFEDALFYDWRFKSDGSLNPEFELNATRYEGASVLLARVNFGCGSSREHAPWALSDYGFRAILAPSFADIFFNNCFKNGLLPVTLDETTIDDLFKRVREIEGYRLTIDLENGTITADDGLEIHFEVDPFRKKCLLEGLDDIGLTLQQEASISEYEKSYALGKPGPSAST
jgi:3-isopropylmalate/(R)-2-methylmalate dehydratase small subunit